MIGAALTMGAIQFALLFVGLRYASPSAIAIVVQRAGDLGALGANAPWGLALAAALLIAIGGVVVILRRRFAMADGNGDGEN